MWAFREFIWERKEALLNLSPLGNYQYDNLCGSLVINFLHSHLPLPALVHEASEALIEGEQSKLKDWTKKRNSEAGGL